MLALSDEKLFEILKESEIVSESDLINALEKSKDSPESFDTYLVSLNLISEENIGKIIADSLNITYINLAQESISDEVLKIVPERVARAQNVIAFKSDDKGIHVATSHPGSREIFKFISIKAGKPVNIHYTTDSNIKNALALYSSEIKESIGSLAKEPGNDKTATDDSSPSSIIDMVGNIIDHAYDNNASDIHIEPLDQDTLVRFRIDGIMHDIIKMPLSLSPQIVTRIKVMANLRTDKHFIPQDGKVVYKTKDEELDIRISIVPLTNGEKVVMRLLSERARMFSLQDLGLSDTAMKIINKAYKNPHGLILSTGPTGSGKTTTLYSIIKLINSRDINIMTIEDPVEYDMQYINQIQVNTKTDLTFAKGLRSIVRQDPDVILVGEIRDEETAGIAVNSAMTGHLVMSTLHTNDAATAFPRLIDMGVEPYLVASTVNIIIAQRLVRKICIKCRVSVEIDVQSLDPEVQKHLGKSKTLSAYKGKGCQVCHNTGYNGRIGVFEVMSIDNDIRVAIEDKKSSEEINDIAVKNGMQTMLMDGIEKVKQGTTTVDELLRVVKE